MLLRSSLSFYRSALSIHLGGGCRFYPSCSEYAQECAEVHSPSHALKLILSRLGKCHPWGPSGFDPVPSRSEIK